MKITDISVTKKGRYAISADGQYLFSLHPDIALTARLTVGDEASVERLEELRQQSELRTAKDRALRLLSGQSYTTRQLREKLTRYADEDASDQAVQRMTELGLLNDADYARRAANDLFHLKGYSPQRIRQELTHRGIEPWLAEEVAGTFEEDDIRGRLAELVRRKYARYLGDEKGRKKTIGALSRLGYPYSDIKWAMEVVLEEAEDLEG